MSDISEKGRRAGQQQTGPRGCRWTQVLAVLPAATALPEPHTCTLRNLHHRLPASVQRLQASVLQPAAAGLAAGLCCTCKDEGSDGSCCVFRGAASTHATNRHCRQPVAGRVAAAQLTWLACCCPVTTCREHIICCLLNVKDHVRSCPKPCATADKLYAKLLHPPVNRQRHNMSVTARDGHPFMTDSRCLASRGSSCCWSSCLKYQGGTGQASP
jgi:hypothetical protein